MSHASPSPVYLSTLALDRPLLTAKSTFGEWGMIQYGYKAVFELRRRNLAATYRKQYSTSDISAIQQRRIPTARQRFYWQSGSRHASCRRKLKRALASNARVDRTTAAPSGTCAMKMLVLFHQQSENSASSHVCNTQVSPFS